MPCFHHTVFVSFIHRSERQLQSHIERLRDRQYVFQHVIETGRDVELEPDAVIRNEVALKTAIEKAEQFFEAQERWLVSISGYYVILSFLPGTCTSLQLVELNSHFFPHF